MTAHVKVDGTWVDTLAVASGVRHSTRWLVDSPSGDHRAQVTLAVDRTFEAEWTLPGRTFEILSPAGLLLWGGVTVNPDRGTDDITLHGYGIGETLKHFEAIELDVGGVWQPTFIPNDAVDAAIARGARFHRGTGATVVDLGNVSVATTDDGKSVDVGTVLTRSAIAAGKRVHVDSTGLITFQADPTAPTLTLTPGHGYMGTADDEFLTRLWGHYNDTPDLGNPGHGVDSVPAVVYDEDTDAEDKFSEREGKIDMSGLGLMTTAQAQAYVEGRFALVGGRMGLTDGVQLDGLTLRHISGAWIPARWVKARHMLRIPGVTDSRLTATTYGHRDIVLSEVTIEEADRPTGFAAPTGFAPRDFIGALSAPESPASKEVA